MDGRDSLDGFPALSPSCARDEGEQGGTVQLSKPSSQSAYLRTDEVLWLEDENRWVGRTSPRLTKKSKRAASEAERYRRDAKPGGRCDAGTTSED